MQKIESQNVNFTTEKIKLCTISLSMKENTVTATIGPSGCVKINLFTLNGMNDLIDDQNDWKHSYRRYRYMGNNTNVDNLRKMVMVSKSQSFSKLFENVAYGLRGTVSLIKNEIEERVVTTIEQVAPGMSEG
jgi:ABC-type phosphate transport system ATPase subunit